MNDDRIWDLYYGLNPEYHGASQQRCRRRLHWLAHNVKPDTALDVGCSQGVLPIFLAREGMRVTGIDIEEPAIRFAKERLSEESLPVQDKVNFILGDIFSFDFKETKFDTIVLGEVLEHLVQPEVLLKRVFELCKPEGRLLLSVPFGLLEHPDHKQTFFMSDIVQLIAQHFCPQQVLVEGQNILCWANKLDRHSVSTTDFLPMLKHTENALLTAQKAAFVHDKQLQEVVVERDALQKQIRILHHKEEISLEERERLLRRLEELSEAADKVSVLEQQVRDATRRYELQKTKTHEAVQETIRKAQIREREFKRQIRDVRIELGESTPFQLGFALVNAAKNPVKLVLLPLTLLRLAGRVLKKKFQKNNRETMASNPYRASRSLPSLDMPPLQTARHANSEPNQTRKKYSAYEGDIVVPIDAASYPGPQKGRVLHLLEYSLPHRQNGYTLRSQNLIRAQQDAGFQPLVVTPPGFPHDGYDQAFCEEEHLDGLTYIRLRGQALQNTSDEALHQYVETYAKGAAKAVEKHQPEILHAASDFKNAYAGLQLAHAFKLPLVYEVRGLWEESRVANGRLTTESPHYQRLRAMEDFCLASANAVVTLGDNLKQHLIERGVHPNKIFVVRNGVDVHGIAKREIREDLQTSLDLKGKKVIGYVGSVTPLECLHIALKGIAELKRLGEQTVLLIVGGGSDVERLQQLAMELQIADDVRFVDSVPHDHIADYYGLLDAVICTRGKDLVSKLVTPLKPFEAMAYKIPVVVPALPALQEAVRDEETGLTFRPGDPVDLALQVRRLFQHPEWSKDLCDAAHQWISKERNWRSVVKAYAPAYEYAASHNE